MPPELGTSNAAQTRDSAARARMSVQPRTGSYPLGRIRCGIRQMTVRLLLLGLRRRNAPAPF